MTPPNLGPTAREVIDGIAPMLEEIRKEMHTGFDKLNGRLHDVEMCQAGDHVEIQNVKADVKTLSIIDKSVAVLSGVAAAIAGVVFGK